MISTTALIASACVLGVATYAFRAVGPVLHTRFAIGETTREFMSTGATVLLVALCATSTFFDGVEWADPARPIAIVVAGVLAWRRLPFLAVVLVAAGVAAGLRLLW